MNEADLIQYLTDTFPCTEMTSHFSYTFFFYRDERMFPFATLALADSDHDRVSNLDRPGVFRLNIGISKATFHALFGMDKIEAANYDYTLLDILMPHPDYAPQHFICVLNPGAMTWVKVRQLLAEAHELAAKRHARNQT